MKKILLTAVIISMIMGLPAFAAEGSDVNQDNDIYRRLSLTMLSQYVDKAIDNYYGEYMTYLPSEDTWDYRILNIERPSPGKYYYTVRLEVLPYVGPHLTVGRDRITMKINLNGVVESVQLDHLESHELPSYYQDIIKKKLPGT